MSFALHRITRRNLVGDSQTFLNWKEKKVENIQTCNIRTKQLFKLHFRDHGRAKYSDNNFPKFLCKEQSFFLSRILHSSPTTFSS